MIAQSQGYDEYGGYGGYGDEYGGGYGGGYGGEYGGYGGEYGGYGDHGHGGRQSTEDRGHHPLRTNWDRLALLAEVTYQLFRF